MSSRAIFMATPTVTASWCCWTTKVKNLWSCVFNLDRFTLDLDDLIQLIYEIKMCKVFLVESVKFVSTSQSVQIICRAANFF